MKKFQDQRESPTGPSFTIGYKQSLELAINTDIPGPGTYPVEKSPARISGGRFLASERFPLDKQKASLPGPGSYYNFEEDVNTNISKLNSSGVTSPKPPEQSLKGVSSEPVFFSKAQRAEISPKRDPALGPGTYEIKREFEKVDPMKMYHKFPTQKKFPSPSKMVQTPGPGTYNYDSFFQKREQRIGFGSSPKDLLSVNLLAKEGPIGDHYYRHNHQLSPFTEKTTSLGFGERMKIKGLEGPGPGAYNLRQVQSPKKQRGKGTFPRSNLRTTVNERNKDPGPGEYDIPELFTPKGVSFTKGSSPLRKSPKDITPGPGQYEIPTFISSSNLLKNRSTSNIFSPANNLSSSIQNVSTTQSILPNKNKFEALERSLRQYASLGGMYNIQNGTIAAQLGKLGPKFSTTGHELEITEKERKESSPGPGQYGELPHGNKNKGFKFSNSPKEPSFVKKETLKVPPPGSYTIPVEKSKIGGKFGQSSRNMQLKKIIKRVKKKEEEKPEENDDLLNYDFKMK